MSGTLGSTDTGLTVSSWLVRKWHLTQIPADHIELDFNRVEYFAVVDADDITHHLGHDNAVSEMGLDSGRFLSRLAVLFCLFALIVESGVSMFDFSGKSSSLPGSEQLDDLLGGEGVNLLRSITLEGVLLDALLFFLNCGHLFIIYYLII